MPQQQLTANCLTNPLDIYSLQGLATGPLSGHGPTTGCTANFNFCEEAIFYLSDGDSLVSNSGQFGDSETYLRFEESNGQLGLHIYFQAAVAFPNGGFQVTGVRWCSSCVNAPATLSIFRPGYITVIVGLPSAYEITVAALNHYGNTSTVPLEITGIKLLP